MSPLNSSLSQSFAVATTSPKIVTNGLVLNLDAGQQNSYNGGTIWRDLSGRGNNGTLVNSPIYSSANGGSIVFDGTNDYLVTPTITLNTNTGFTIDLWIYINDPQPVYSNFWSYWYSDSQNDFEWGTYATGASQGRFLFKDSGAIGTPFIQSPYIGNQWANVTFGCSATTPFLYTNGSFTGTAGNFRNTNITITNLLRNNGASTYYKASHSSIKFYNRALTATEISQNFNATRGRFGI